MEVISIQFSFLKDKLGNLQDECNQSTAYKF